MEILNEVNWKPSLDIFRRQFSSSFYLFIFQINDQIVNRFEWRIITKHELFAIRQSIPWYVTREIYVSLHIEYDEIKKNLEIHPRSRNNLETYRKSNDSHTLSWRKTEYRFFFLANIISSLAEFRSRKSEKNSSTPRTIAAQIRYWTSKIIENILLLSDIHFEWKKGIFVFAIYVKKWIRNF